MSGLTVEEGLRGRKTPLILGEGPPYIGAKILLLKYFD
jgi:hypothetical protein